MSGDAELTGRVALVTGASRGIGRAIALALARSGAEVAVHYNSGRQEAETTLASVVEAGGSGFTIQADLARRDGARSLATAFTAALRERSGAPDFDILVNNAGLGGKVSFDAVTEDAFDRMVQVNLKTPFFLIQHLAPHIRDGGRIVNISSMGARAAYTTMPVYAPTKAALDVLSRNLALEFGPRGITVNSVMPGATATDMNRAAADPDKARETARTIALGRVGNPEDIAAVVAFLVSRAGGWVTGQRLDASGGQRL